MSTHTIVSYIDKATETLQKTGITVKAEANIPVLKLLDIIARLDHSRVLAIGRILQQQSAMNTIVRDQIAGMQVVSLHHDIANSFHTIREDAEQMIDWLEDGRLDWAETIADVWIKLKRGSIPERFEQIKKNYQLVAKNTSDQLVREHSIVDAYQDCRLALKQAEITCLELLKHSEDSLAQAEFALQQAQNKADNALHMDSSEQAPLQLKHAEALRQLHVEDKCYQTVKHLHSHLTASYQATETILAHLQQMLTLKEAIYQQSVTFFTANEMVFTALSAIFKTTDSEFARVKMQETMQSGLNSNLHILARAETGQIEQRLQKSNGNIQQNSVRHLIDAIVSYQQSSQQLIDELSNKRTQSAQDFQKITEISKQSLVEIL